MEAVPSSPSPLRIVIVPWLAFGHLLPYLELAERLASRGHRVSYISTPRNLARLPPLRSASAPLVDLVALPLPHVDDLTHGAESTNDVPDEQRELHWMAFDGLAMPFTEFMAAACADEGRRPHWIMADTFNHWVAASAVEHKVPCAFLLPSAAMIAMPGQMAEHLAGHAEAELAGADSVPRYEREAFATVFTSDGKASGMSIIQRLSLRVSPTAAVSARAGYLFRSADFADAARAAASCYSSSAK